MLRGTIDRFSQLSVLCSAFAVSTMLSACLAPAVADDVGSEMVIGAHEIELVEGVDASEFENYVKQKFAPAWKKPRGGMRIVVVKGDRGARKNKYQLVFTFDSVETRNKFFPKEGGEASAEYLATVQPVGEEMEGLFKMIVEQDGPYTDYIALGGSSSTPAQDKIPVYGVHDFEIRKGADTAKLDAMIREEFAPAWKQSDEGLRMAIMKGDRGERKGKYQLVYVFDSAADRDKFFPDEGGGATSAFQQVVGRRIEVMQGLGQYLGERTSFSDLSPIR